MPSSEAVRVHATKKTTVPLKCAYRDTAVPKANSACASGALRQRGGGPQMHPHRRECWHFPATRSTCFLQARTEGHQTATVTETADAPRRRRDPRCRTVIS